MDGWNAGSFAEGGGSALANQPHMYMVSTAVKVLEGSVVEGGASNHQPELARIRKACPPSGTTLTLVTLVRAVEKTAGRAGDDPVAILRWHYTFDDKQCHCRLFTCASSRQTEDYQCTIYNKIQRRSLTNRKAKVVSANTNLNRVTASSSASSDHRPLVMRMQNARISHGEKTRGLQTTISTPGFQDFLAWRHWRWGQCPS